LEKREQSLRVLSFACRDGERHPGLLEGGSLRGASLEWRPRSVRERAVVPPSFASAPATADVRRQPRRGTWSAYAVLQKRMHPAPARDDRRRRSGTRPSLGPSTRARQSLLHTVGAILGGKAFEVASRLGKPAQAGGTSTGAVMNGRSAARRMSSLPQGSPQGMREEGRRSRPPSLARFRRARVWLPARSGSCRSR